MATPARRPLPKGIYTPLPTFFRADGDDSEALDLDAFSAHVARAAREGGTVPVVAGSAGEAPHLSAEERGALIRAARAVLDEEDEHGRGASRDTPVVAGVGAASTRETVRLASLARDAGADYAMVVPPGYYAGALDAEALVRFFVDVAEASPLPVIIYNFPGVSAGIDLSSDVVVDAVRRSANIVGVKLTCASVGKITRINAEVSSNDFKRRYPRADPAQEFRIIDGYIDILLPSIASGAAGAISGLPNLIPKTCARLWALSDPSGPSHDFQAAQELQGRLAIVDGFMQKIGFAGMKMLLHKRFGYSPLPRRPLLPSKESDGDEWMRNPLLAALLEEEKRL